MAMSTGARLTKAGQKLLTELHGNEEKLRLTAFVLGSESWSEEELEAGELTTLKNERLRIPIKEIETGGETAPNRVKCRGVVTNQGLEESFMVQEVGILALTPADEEILYMIDSIPRGEAIVVVTSDTYTQTFPVIMDLAVTSGSDIALSITDDVYLVTLEELKKKNYVTAEEMESRFSEVQGFKNHIINGNFDVWQRGERFEEVTVGYGADRWYLKGKGNIRRNGNAMVVECTQAGTYFRNALECSELEMLSGKTITVSCYARSENASSVNLALHQYSGAGGDDNIIRYDREFEIGPEWSRLVHTVRLEKLPDGFISNRATAYLLIGFSRLEEGKEYEVKECQLEIGDKATAFEFRPAFIEEQLCKRYYERLDSGTIFSVGYSTGDHQGFFVVPYHPKRIAPVACLSGSFSVRNLLNDAQDGCSIKTYLQHMQITCQFEEDKALEEREALLFYSTSGGYMEISAEYGEIFS